MTLPIILLSTILLMPIVLGTIASITMNKNTGKEEVKNKTSFKKVNNFYSQKEAADEIIVRLTETKKYLTIFNENKVFEFEIGIQKAYYVQKDNKIRFQINLFDNRLYHPRKNYDIKVKKDNKNHINVDFYLQDSYKISKIDEDLLKCKSFLTEKLNDYEASIKEPINNDIIKYKNKLQEILSNNEELKLNRLNNIIDSQKILKDIKTLTDVLDFASVELLDNKGIHLCHKTYHNDNELYLEKSMVKMLYDFEEVKLQKHIISIKLYFNCNVFKNLIDTACEIKDYLSSEYENKYDLFIDAQSDPQSNGKNRLIYYALSEK